MPDLITFDDRYSDMLTWLWGAGIDGNIHKKENWISGTDINPNPSGRKESPHIVYYDELEKDDWEEIVHLIEKRKKGHAPHFSVTNRKPLCCHSSGSVFRCERSAMNRKNQPGFFEGLTSRSDNFWGREKWLLRPFLYRPFLSDFCGFLISA